MLKQAVIASALAALALGGVAACASAPDTAQTASMNGERTCREMLMPNSNTHQTVCGTDAQWEEFDRREAFRGAETVRMFQGSNYAAGR